MGQLLLKVAGLLVVGLLAYNYFFGTPAEKESSAQVFAQVKDLSSSVVNLLKSEKEKFDEGKYNDALARLKTAIGLEREHAESLGEQGEECLAHCEHLHERGLSLEAELQAVSENADLTESDRQAAVEGIHDRILQLAGDTETLAGKLRL